MVSAVGTVFIVLIVLAVAAAIGWVVFTQLRARRLGLPAPPLSSYNPFARSDPSPFADPQQPTGPGVGGWFRDKFAALRNRRSAAGAYEGHSLNAAPGRRRGGFGPLDPDDAWDVRVGHEADLAYHPEDDLGRDGAGAGGFGSAGAGAGANNPYPYSANAYVGSGYQMNLPTTTAADEERGRSRSRGPGGSGFGVDIGNGSTSYKGAGSSSRNPFDDDDAEPSNLSLRGVSPRPIIDTTAAVQGGKAKAVAAADDSPTTAAERRSIFRENV
ncbi:hypothetical protein F4779DRAFT_559588 [Xylariaceae sp. FL0662B]|nr:hypothetical protein F4779DRAFT_559588 [Xylariaceae sp. FL0662B]